MIETRNPGTSLGTISEVEDEYVEVPGAGAAPLLRRQRSLPPRYNEIFPDEDENTAPTAPPVQFDLVPIQTHANIARPNTMLV